MDLRLQIFILFCKKNKVGLENILRFVSRYTTSLHGVVVFHIAIIPLGARGDCLFEFVVLFRDRALVTMFKFLDRSISRGKDKPYDDTGNDNTGPECLGHLLNQYFVFFSNVILLEQVFCIKTWKNDLGILTERILKSGTIVLSCNIGVFTLTLSVIFKVECNKLFV